MKPQPQLETTLHRRVEIEIVLPTNQRFQLLGDLQAFRKMFNLGPNDPKALLYGSVDPGFSSSIAHLEADMDLQLAGAIAP